LYSSDESLSICACESVRRRCFSSFSFQMERQRKQVPRCQLALLCMRTAALSTWRSRHIMETIVMTNRRASAPHLLVGLGLPILSVAATVAPARDCAIHAKCACSQGVKAKSDVLCIAMRLSFRAGQKQDVRSSSSACKAQLSNAAICSLDCSKRLVPNKGSLDCFT
jgi:hypothetical protein